MDNTDHIHRFSLSTWVFYTLLGSFLLLLVVIGVGISIQELISGKSTISDYLGIALTGFFLLPSGLLLLLYPFVTRIVIKANGLEYHAFTYILSSDWKDLINIGFVENTLAGKTLVVVPQGGELRIRNWAMPFRKILIKNPQDLQIMVAQFGSTNGHPFETDILVNVGQSEEFGNELETLE